MREYRRAILASDDELNVQTQRLAFGVRISISDPSLKRERRIDTIVRILQSFIILLSNSVRKHVHGLYGIDMA